MPTRLIRRRGGFSLVELLVTIIIAGIAFLAMVPLFVQASQTSQGERSRNVARNLAQDRIEKIRVLGYADITLANLESSTFYGSGVFGTTASSSGTGGASKTYLVKYSVREYTYADVLIPDGSPASGTGAHKKVSVTLSWGIDTNNDGIGDTGKPSPIKPVTLATIFYKQWSGPQIVNLTAGSAYTPQLADFPDAAHYDQHSGERWLYPPYSIAASLVTATIFSEDMRFMTNPADATDRGYVRFTVTPQRGAALAPWVEYHAVAAPVSAAYSHSWAWSALPEGVYRLDATAFAYDLKQGNTFTIYVRIEKGAPAAPASLTATAGSNQVLLSWPASTAGDYDHYEVRRVNKTTLETTLLQGPTENLQASSYIDSTAVNDTTYTYSVYVVDQIGLSSPAVSQDATPSTIAGVKPNAPIDLKVVASGATAMLTWQTPTTTPAPIVGYDVFKDGVFLKNTTSTSTSDVVGYDSDHHYQVQAKTAVGMASDYATLFAGQSSFVVGGVAWARVVIGAPATYTIHVTTSNKAWTVFLEVSHDNGVSWSSVGSSWAIPAGSSHDWTSQPAGIYRAYYIQGIRKYGSPGTVTASGPSGTSYTIAF